MYSEKNTPIAERVSRFGSILTIILALFGIFGYIPGLELLGSFHPDFIPMAPSTAISFLILSLVILSYPHKIQTKKDVFLGIGFSLAVIFYGFLKFLEYLSGHTHSFEEIFLGQMKTFSGFPVGVMSPLTGGLFVLLGMGIVFLLLKSIVENRRHCSGIICGYISLAVIALSAFFVLSYVLKQPFFYDQKKVVPMALTTALAFLCSGVSLIAANGCVCLPLSTFCGNSTTARLIRVFVPLIVGISLLQELGQGVARKYFIGHDVLVIAGQMTAYGFLVAFCVFWIGRRIGSAIDRAQLDLRESEARFRDIFYNAAEGMLIADVQEKKFVQANPAICRMFGYTEKEMLCLGVKDIHPQESLPEVIAAFEKQSREGNILVEVPCLRNDRTIFYAQISASEIIQEGRKCSLGFFTDVTDRRKAEIELKRERYFLTRAQEIGNIGTWEMDVVNNNLVWTEQNYRIFGVPVGTKLTYESFLNCVHPDDRNHVNEQWQAAVNGKPYELEHRIIIDGKVKWIKEKAELEIDEQGKCLRAIGFSQDVTERKNIQESLQEREVRLRQLGDNLPDGLVYQIDSGVDGKERRFMHISAGVEKLHGFKPEQVLDDAGIIYDQIISEDRKMLAEREAFAFSNKIPFAAEVRVRLSTGELRWRSFSSAPRRLPNNHLVWDGIEIDITERKKSEIDLEESGKKFRAIFENSLNALAIHKAVLNKQGEMTDYVFLMVNPMFEKETGLSGERIIGKRVAEVMPGIEKEPFIKIYGDVVLHGIPVRFEQYNKTLDKYFNISAFRIEEGIFVVAFNDVTLRKKAEEELTKSQAVFQDLFENMSSGGAIYEAVDDGANFVFRAFNKSAERIEKTRREEVLGRRVTEVFPGVVDLGLIEVFRRVWKSGISEFSPAGLYQDNRMIGWRENYIYKLPSGEVVAIYDDLTEQKQSEEREKELIASRAAAEVEKKKAQEIAAAYQQLKETQDQLLQAEKLASLGELGAGLAHELNSPLAGVLSLLRSYRKSRDQSSQEFEDLRIMEEACVHMAKIIRDLNDFAKQSKGETEELDMVEAVETLLSFSAHQFKSKGIAIHKFYGAELWKIRGNKNQLQQVIMNILNNARDAISDNGEVAIAIRNSAAGEKRSVEIEIADTGTGINPDYLSRIFDPFFTTKRPGKGVGLGLSVSYKIIKNHGGEIFAENRSDVQGAKFIVRLPAI